ncbi:MAG: site-specific integrase [Spirochaetales bacterium]|nr:site-specific integrase [Spirochaetales bacterium]
MKLIQKNGKYYLLIKRKLYSLHTSDKNIAERIFCDMITQEIVRKVYLSVKIHHPTYNLLSKKTEKIEIADKIDEYVKTADTKGLSKGKVCIKSRIGRLLSTCGIIYFSDFTQNTVNLFVEKLSYLSDSSKKTYITQLRAFMNYSVKRRFMSEALYKSIDFPQIKEKPREIIISDEDMALFWSSSVKDDDFHVYLMTLYNTVCRPNEAANLRVSDFDFANRKATIFMNKVKRYKTVYLTHDFCDILSDYIERHGKTEYLFRGACSREYYAKKFRRLKSRLGIKIPYTLYVVRHTAITNLMNKCHDVEFVARQAGNDPKTTMKHYVNRDDRHCLAILDGME